MKPLFWIGSSRKDLKRFPPEMQDRMGYALRDAQLGGQRASTKVLRGFGHAGVLEIVADSEGNAYRAVYTIRFADVVYVLHAFGKKSIRGIATPRKELELVRVRLGAAERHYQEWRTRT